MELAEYFLKKFTARQGKPMATIPRAVLTTLEQYDWPGNIRELQNVIERGVMTTGSELSFQTTEPLPIAKAVPARSSVAEPTSVRTMAEAERAHITATLRATNWVVGGPNGAAAKTGAAKNDVAV